MGWDEVKDGVAKRFDSLDNDVKDLKGNALPYAALLQSTLQGLRMTTASTALAFTHGDNMGGIGGILGMVGSLMPLMGIAGPAWGTVGAIIGGILDLVGSIVAAFGPKLKTLKQELEEALGHLHAQLIHDEVVGAMRDLERAAVPLGRVTDGSRTWETMQSGYIDMIEGNAAHQLGVTRSWLGKPENQANPEWTLVFEAFWCVAALRTMVFSTIVTKLDAKLDAKSIGTAALLDRFKRDRVFAKSIYDVALNKGTLWHIGNRGVYVRDGVITKMPDHKQIADGGKRLAVGPYSRRLYVLDGDQVRLRDDPDDPVKWRSLFLTGIPDASDLWAATRPIPPAASDVSPDDEDAVFPQSPERIVVVSKGGQELRWGYADGTKEAFTVKVNQAKVRQLRSFQRPDGIHYFLLGGSGDKSIYYMPEKARNADARNAMIDVFLFPLWNMNERLFVELGETLRGIAIGKDQNGDDQLLAYSEKKLYYRTFTPNQDFAVKDKASNWNELPRPKDEPGAINCVVGSRDAHLFVIFGDKLWVYAPTTIEERRKRVVTRAWIKEPQGDMKWVAQEPVAGFDVFNGCRTTPPAN